MNIIGHQKIKKYLNKNIEKDKIFHAYIFSGPENLGKFTLALEFAKKITAETKSKINSDIIIISPEIEEKKGKIKKKDIKIEKIRELKHDLSLSATAEKYKVVIIDEAERLTKASQNALLKTLEEPPEKVVIILIVKNSNKIIPTIKSRCLIKKFGLVSEFEMKDYLKEDNNLEEILFWSFGRPGLAITLQEKGGELEKRKKARENLEKIFKLNLSEKFSFCENLSKNVPEIVEELNLWTVIFRESILGKNKFFQLNPQKALVLITKIEKSLEMIIETNSNPRLVMENLVLEF